MEGRSGVKLERRRAFAEKTPGNKAPNMEERSAHRTAGHIAPLAQAGFSPVLEAKVQD